MSFPIIKYEYFNNNPYSDENQQYRSEGGDCVIRSVSKLLNISWLEAYDELCSIGRELYTKPTSIYALRECMRRHGWSYIRLAIKEPDGMTFEKFIDSCSDIKGSYLLRLDGHCVPMIDGVIYDDSLMYFTKIIAFFFKGTEPPFATNKKIFLAYSTEDTDKSVEESSEGSSVKESVEESNEDKNEQ